MLEMFASFLGMLSFILFVISVLAAWGKVEVPENSFEFMGFNLSYEFTKKTPYAINCERVVVKE